MVLNKAFIRHLILDITHALTSGQKLHEQVQIQFILKTVEHFHHPETVCLNQDVPLRPDMSHLRHNTEGNQKQYRI